MLINQGQTLAKFQKREELINEIGEAESSWIEVCEHYGYLDYTGGQHSYRKYDTKLEESTHIFISEYFNLDLSEREGRVEIEGKLYDILLIDNPMNMNRQLEIYLKYVGI